MLSYGAKDSLVKLRQTEIGLPDTAVYYHPADFLAAFPAHLAQVGGGRPLACRRCCGQAGGMAGGRAAGWAGGRGLQRQGRRRGFPWREVWAAWLVLARVVLWPRLRRLLPSHPTEPNGPCRAERPRAQAEPRLGRRGHLGGAAARLGAAGRQWQQQQQQQQYRAAGPGHAHRLH